MRLTECYIDNFGKLSDKSYSFSEGFNGFCEENGYGKSTLADFIKAMLFGLDDTKKAKLEENERKKYEPWQGGKWGGSLSFEYGGRKYRIERSFAKKASLDERRIFNAETGKECFDFPDEPGESIFGIDKDGFERTVFLSEKQLNDKCENKTISAKLSDLTGVEDDITGLDGALERLEDTRKYYYKQGGGGAIGELGREIAELEFKMREFERLNSKHEEDKKLARDLSNKLKKLRERLDTERSREEKNALRRELLSEFREKKKRYGEELKNKNALLMFFCGRVPTKNELYEAISCENEIRALKDKLASSKVSIADEKAQEALNTTTIIYKKLRENQAKAERLEKEKNNTGAVKSHLFLIVTGFLTLIAAALLGALINPIIYLFALLAPILIFIGFKKKRAFLRKGDEAIGQLYEERRHLQDKLKKIAMDFSLADSSPEMIIATLNSRIIGEKEKAANFAKDAARLDEARKKYADFVSRYPTKTQNPVAEINEKLSEYETLSALCDSLYAECEKMQQKYGFDPADAASEESCGIATDTAEKIRETESELAILSSIIRKDELLLGELEATSVKIEERKNLEALYKHRLSVIKKTREYLEAAKDSLNARYLGKTKASFLKYCSLISGIEAEFGIDTSFALTKIEGGATKPKEAYSKGTRDLYSFALRLALIDSLYEKDMPFLVLDDPFAYFDDKKLEEAKALIKKLAKQRQIIYLTSTRARLPL